MHKGSCREAEVSVVVLGVKGRRSLRLVVWASLAATAVTAGAAVAAAAVHVISQRGREFQPHELVIQRGDTLQIVNDDDDLIHHAFIESSDFSFDSGDQKPGSRTDVAFTKSGVFMVLCAIHPKMKLRVTVQE